MNNKLKALTMTLVAALIVSLGFTVFFMYKYGNPWSKKPYVNEGEGIFICLNYSATDYQSKTFERYYSVRINNNGSKTLIYCTDNGEPLYHVSGEAPASVYYDMVEYLNSCDLINDSTPITWIGSLPLSPEGVEYPVLVAVETDHLDTRYYYTDDLSIIDYCAGLEQFCEES